MVSATTGCNIPQEPETVVGRSWLPLQHNQGGSLCPYIQASDLVVGLRCDAASDRAFLSDSVVLLFQIFPGPILGVTLFSAGVEL